MNTVGLNVKAISGLLFQGGGGPAGGVVSDLQTTFPSLINIFSPKEIANFFSQNIKKFFRDIQKCFRIYQNFSGHTKNFPDISKFVDFLRNFCEFSQIFPNSITFSSEPL